MRPRCNCVINAFRTAIIAFRTADHSIPYCKYGMQFGVQPALSVLLSYITESIVDGKTRASMGKQYAAEFVYYLCDVSVYHSPFLHIDVPRAIMEDATSCFDHTDIPFSIIHHLGSTHRCCILPFSLRAVLCSAKLTHLFLIKAALFCCSLSSCSLPGLCPHAALQTVCLRLHDVYLSSACLVSRSALHCSWEIPCCAFAVLPYAVLSISCYILSLSLGVVLCPALLTHLFLFQRNSYLCPPLPSVSVRGLCPLGFADFAAPPAAFLQNFWLVCCWLCCLSCPSFFLLHFVLIFETRAVLCEGYSPLSL